MVFKKLLLIPAFFALSVAGEEAATPVHWESSLSGDKPCMYSFDGENDSFVDEMSMEDKPEDWYPELVNCEVDPNTKRCVGAEPFFRQQAAKSSVRGRGLQNPEGYIRVAFGDNAVVSQAARDIFQDAADTWNRVIAANTLRPLGLFLRGRNPDVISFNFGLGCGRGRLSDTFTLTTDITVPANLVILAEVEPIDGLGRVLASAGPCFTARDAAGNTQTYIGAMSFDSADFNSQLRRDRRGLFNTVLHEMGHVLGVGTFWRGLVANPVSRNPRNLPTYTGINGIEGFRDIGGRTGRPRVENDGGRGTADSHWDEETFRNELMTGFLNRGPNPMSIMTIKSLLDIGLVVNECAAEDFGQFTVDPDECSRFLNPNSVTDPDNGITRRSIESAADNARYSLAVVGAAAMIALVA